MWRTHDEYCDTIFESGLPYGRCDDCGIVGLLCEDCEDDESLCGTCWAERHIFEPLKARKRQVAKKEAG